MNEHHFAAPFDDSAAHIEVVFTNGGSYQIKSKAMFGQFCGIDPHLKLFFIPAPRVYLSHPANFFHLRSNDPIMDSPQLGDVVTFAGYHIMKHLPKAGGNRAHPGSFQALGQLHCGQPFVHKLPCEIDIGPVLENRHNLG